MTPTPTPTPTPDRENPDPDVPEADTPGLVTVTCPGDHITTFTTDELTAHCPFDFGGPDFYELTIRYEPDAAIVETRSLKEYVKSFRATEITGEGLGVVIHSDVVHEADPSRCYVRLEQAIRGGIQETVEVGDMDLAESR